MTKWIVSLSLLALVVVSIASHRESRAEPARPPTLATPELDAFLQIIDDGVVPMGKEKKLSPPGGKCSGPADCDGSSTHCFKSKCVSCLAGGNSCTPGDKIYQCCDRKCKPAAKGQSPTCI